MKKSIIAVLAVVAITGTVLYVNGHNNQEGVGKKDLAGRVFVREKGGFGSDFTITLKEDGTYTYYEGALSSYIGAGNWSLKGDVLTLTEISGYEFVFHFKVEKDALVFMADQSNSFIYVKAEDGDRFTVKENTGD